MIKKIKGSLRGTDSISIFHDTRSDVRILAKICNQLIDKVNELTDEINKLSKINSNS